MGVLATHSVATGSRYFGTSERFWLNPQAQYDLDVEYDRVGNRIEKEIEPYVHLRLTSSRCQRSMVSGLTTNEDHRPLGIARLAAASRSLSGR